MKPYKISITIKSTIFILLFIIFTSNYSFANSAPIIMENSPSFSIAPVDSTPIEITRESLKFDLTEGRGNIAKVTALYEMKNTSDKSIDQAMIFPFVTSPMEGFVSSVLIKADNNPVDFNTIRVADIPNINTLRINYRNGFNKELEELIGIDNIISLLQNRNQYNPQSFKLDDRVRVYTLHIPIGDEPYKAEIEYELLDSNNQKLLLFNFNSFSMNKDGKGKLGAWSNSNNSVLKYDKAYIAIMGNNEENKVVIESITNQNITSEDMILEDFISNIIYESINNRNEEYGLSHINYDGYYSDIYEHIIENMDIRFKRGENFFALDSDGFASFSYTTYLGAFLYSIRFEPNSTVLVSVEYEMHATMDRSKTKDFSYNYLYLLNPASKWRSFGELHIEIIPNEYHPFIIESSIDLNKDEAGIYSISLGDLPDKDLYFVTYKTDKPDPPIKRHFDFIYYLLFYLIPPLILIILTVLCTFIFIRWFKRSNKGF